MTRHSIVLFVLFVLAALPVRADNPTQQDSNLKSSMQTGGVTPTPEMWFYEQYRQQYQDPREAVRQKAEFRANQRQRRLAAMKWFGYSNSRPRCGVDPVVGEWSPAWTSNNAAYPWRWTGYGRPRVSVW